MIAFVKEGSRASLLALSTSRFQYLRWETKHSEEQRVHQRENGGWERDQPALQGSLRLLHRCWLTAHRSPERWVVQTLKHQRNRPWGEKSQILKTSSCQALLDSQFMSSSGGQTPSSRGPTSRDRAQPPGLWLQAPSTSTDAQRTWTPPASKVG